MCPELQVQWCLYFTALMVYHFMEFTVTAFHQPGTVTFECQCHIIAVL